MKTVRAVFALLCIVIALVIEFGVCQMQAIELTTGSYAYHWFWRILQAILILAFASLIRLPWIARWKQE